MCLLVSRFNFGWDSLDSHKKPFKVFDFFQDWPSWYTPPKASIVVEEETGKPSSPSMTVPASTQRLVRCVQLKIRSKAPVVEDKASKVLNVLQSFGQHTSAMVATQASDWPGKWHFLPKVQWSIARNEPVMMILPAFPWKSVNQVDKVLGQLPDLGEVLALARLNHLCEKIKEIYEPGAEVYIATDGFVFDDIVGISDEVTWNYSEELSRLIQRHDFCNLKLVRGANILGLTEKVSTRESYLALVRQCREKLLREYGRSEGEVRNMIQTDCDSLSTYCGFIKFLETDLRHSPVASATTSGSQYRKVVKKVAINMMIRAESFTKLLQAKYPNFVRLSIHRSSGTAKLSIPLIVQAGSTFPRTPWHCTVALGIDGSYRTVHAQEVRGTHRLVLFEGRPYYYREKSPLWDWEDDMTDFEPRYPSGIRVSPRIKSGPEGVLSEANIQSLRALARVFKGTVEVSGFSNADQVFVS